LDTGAGAGKTFVKDSFYGEFKNVPKVKPFYLRLGLKSNSPEIFGDAKDGLDLLPEKNMDKYRLQRRLLGPAYSFGQVKDYESGIDKTVTDNVATMRETAGKSECVNNWFNFFALGTDH
jgi:hypothetical protein